MVPMNTLEEKQSMNTNSLPNEIIEEILTRLPVKSLLKFKSVSKPWFSFISSPTFAKLHFTRTNTSYHSTLLFITMYDSSTHKRHFLSASLDDRHVTHLTTIPIPPKIVRDTILVEHLNGLVLCTSGNGFSDINYAFVINPATRNFYKLTSPPGMHIHVKSTTPTRTFCFFGFDESRNEHKVLYIRMIYNQFKSPFRLDNIEFMMFSLSNYTWRKIDVELPSGISEDWSSRTKGSVCINSVIHLMPYKQNVILAFDLSTEKFAIINLPRELVRGVNVKNLMPRLMKVHNLLGVVCYYSGLNERVFYIWLLEDYENRVWVKLTVPFNVSRDVVVVHFPKDFVNSNEMVFSPGNFYGGVMRIPIYDMKMRSYKTAEFTLGHEFLHSNTLELNEVTSYAESILPVERTDTTTS